MRTETITWHDLPADGLPDSDITVLLAVHYPPDPDAVLQPASVETCMGWWAGDRWLDASSGGGVEHDGARVLAWADMPVGVQNVAANRPAPRAGPG